MRIIFPNPELCVSILRNGSIKTKGLEIEDCGSTIWIQAITSKGVPAVGFIEIDKESIPDLINLLNSLK